MPNCALDNADIVRAGVLGKLSCERFSAPSTKCASSYDKQA